SPPTTNPTRPATAPTCASSSAEPSPRPPPRTLPPARPPCSEPEDPVHETILGEICTFCCEVEGGDDSNLFYDLGLAHTRADYVLLESEHFVVMPCIGALTDWYLIIVSKRHTL